ncbi:ARF-binding protein [Mycoemilia scoparia]|uniref:ARF-binding protein n=1 Tax=Mycoemilia scoparia TaxID=417184 RepID=A0A9W8A3S5_9FUNG|nr:ARF-binding protein [Mycoemilia scoparia]
MNTNLQQALGQYFTPPTRLQTMIDKACDYERVRSDLGLNLEICDLVNRKKGNYPHEAVFGLLQYINGRHQNQALLALNLLDYLVKNCGHPVHYQIASRDFLNQLFRKFPEYQPPIPHPVQYRILEMLLLWRNTLCKHSRHKDDLTRINDMYRLLLRKGWEFPEVEEGNAAIMLGPQESLKSREELEKEDLEAMKTKLQELLRRATPHDLREANRLMKIITGYEVSSKQKDYDKEWEKELENIEERSGLLRDMINNAEPGQRIDDTIKDIYFKCVSSQAKLAKIIKEKKKNLDEDDEEENRQLETLVDIKDKLDDVIQMYKDLNDGKQPQSNLENKGSGGNAQHDNNLIAWDDDESNTAEMEQPDAGVETPASKNPLDDLLGLSFEPQSVSPSPADTSRSRITPGQTAIYLPPSINSASQSATPEPTGMLARPIHQSTSVNAGGSAQSKKKADAFDFGDLLGTAKNISQQQAMQKKSTQNTMSSSSKPQYVSNNTDSLIDL